MNEDGREGRSTKAKQMGNNQMHNGSVGLVDKERPWMCPTPLRSGTIHIWWCLQAGPYMYAADRDNSLIDALCGETDRFGLLGNEFVLVLCLGSVLPVYTRKWWKG